MDIYNFMHCPRPHCLNKLTPPWDNYIIGKEVDVITGKDIPIYKCPHCGFVFTVNSLTVNDVEVTGFNKHEKFILIDSDNNLLGEFFVEEVFEVSGRHFIHIPSKYLKEGARFLSIAASADTQEVIKSLKENTEGNNESING